METTGQVLAQRSQRMTSSVMAVFVLAHAVESIRAAIGVSPCPSGSGQAVVSSTLVHCVGSVLLSLLLASQAWPKLPGSSSMAFLSVTELSLRVILVWLTAEATLLSPFRFQQDIVWRVLFGLCASPLLGMAGNIAYSAAVIGCFASRVPADSVAFFSEQSAGIYLSGGCVSFQPGGDLMALGAFFSNLNQDESGI